MKVTILSKKEGNTPYITISCDDDSAKIYYTLDGSTPNTNCILYSDDIDYPKNTTIKAIAIKDGEQSEIAEYKCSIPIIYFNGHLTVLNTVDYLGDYIYTKSITFGPEGKVYNAKLYKSMIYPLGLNLKEHVVPGDSDTEVSRWTNFVEGQVIYDPDLKKMKLFNGTEWVNIDGTPLNINNSGTTTNRPTNVQIGFIYKDTTLNKLILWEGTKWVNLDGTELTQ